MNPKFLNRTSNPQPIWTKHDLTKFISAKSNCLFKHIHHSPDEFFNHHLREHNALHSSFISTQFIKIPKQRITEIPYHSSLSTLSYTPISFGSKLCTRIKDSSLSYSDSNALCSQTQRLKLFLYSSSMRISHHSILIYNSFLIP